MNTRDWRHFHIHICINICIAKLRSIYTYMYIPYMYIPVTSLVRVKLGAHQVKVCASNSPCSKTWTIFRIHNLALQRGWHGVATFDLVKCCAPSGVAQLLYSQLNLEIFEVSWTCAVLYSVHCYLSSLFFQVKPCARSKVAPIQCITGESDTCT